ncbi:hypothetical protein SUDANB176_00303 [Streptomyces sp. enrichment culture]
MKAVVIRTFGDPDGLEVVDVPAPVPAPGQVQIATEAIGVGGVDAVIRRGTLAAYGFREGHLLGSEVAGRVTAVGEGVDASWIGRRVWAFTGLSGGYAEQAVAAVEDVLALPDGLTAADAVTLGGSGVFAHFALDRALRRRCTDRTPTRTGGMPAGLPWSGSRGGFRGSLQRCRERALSGSRGPKRLQGLVHQRRPVFGVRPVVVRDSPRPVAPFQPFEEQGQLGASVVGKIAFPVAHAGVRDGCEHGFHRRAFELGCQPVERPGLVAEQSPLRAYGAQPRVGGAGMAGQPPSDAARVPASSEQRSANVSGEGSRSRACANSLTAHA